MTDFTIRVTPDVLRSASEEIQAKAGIIEDIFSEMCTKVQQTSSFWIGDAAALHRALFEDQIPVLETIVSNFKTHAEKLTQIADNYANTQVTVVADVEGLPDDVIT